jgi:DNA-binding transcriptional MerR regulator
MEPLLPIGRFSQLCRLSIKTLRYYDEVGLLKPAHIDPWTNYRYYTLEQAQTADRIRLLRTTEMPIEEIAKWLTTSDEAVRQAIVMAHQTRLHERIAVYHDALSLLTQMQTAPSISFPYEVRLERVEAQTVIGIRNFVAWQDVETVMGVGFADLSETLAHQHQAPTGAPIAIYHHTNDTMAEATDGMDTELAIPVRQPLVETERVKNSTLPAGVAAVTTHIGAYHEVTKAYQAIQGWLQAHGHESAGLNLEVYLTNPTTTPNPRDYRTEIYWLIQPT